MNLLRLKAWLHWYFIFGTDLVSYLEIGTPLFYIRLVHEGIGWDYSGAPVYGLWSGVMASAIPVPHMVESEKLYRFSKLVRMGFIPGREVFERRQREMRTL